MVLSNYIHGFGHLYIWFNPTMCMVWPTLVTCISLPPNPLAGLPLQCLAETRNQGDRHTEARETDTQKSGRRGRQRYREEARETDTEARDRHAEVRETGKTEIQGRSQGDRKTDAQKPGRPKTRETETRETDTQKTGRQ